MRPQAIGESAVCRLSSLENSVGVSTWEKSPQGKEKKIIHKSLKIYSYCINSHTKGTTLCYCTTFLPGNFFVFP